ncbi:MAG: hypothetical protein IID44_09880 [Planctomycetes bacterium]|nr:hypothetical protein [Planctomycetota bacterium]
MVDNDCDENDILLTPMEAVSNAHKTKCEQCNGLGSLPDPTVVPDTYDFGFAPRQIQCALCEGKGFTIEGGVNIDSAAPHLAAAMADRQTDNAAQLVYGVSPGATQSDFDEDDILLPNQF